MPYTPPSMTFGKWPGWPIPHTCSWCATIEFDVTPHHFAGSNSTSTPHPVPVTVHWSKTWPRNDSRMIATITMYDTADVHCFDLWSTGLKTGCRLAEMIIQKLDVIDSESPSAISACTADGQLSLRSPAGKRLVFAVDTMTNILASDMTQDGLKQLPEYNEQAMYSEILHELQTCDESHTECQRCTSSSSFKPSRVVEIVQGPPDWSIKLHRPTQAVKYAALSYCWGGVEQLQTMRRNEDDFFSSIPFESLQKSIRDALQYCAHLNLQYLWVDSLCIVQDDDSSKNHEIAFMAEIYGQAELTICISTARSASEGSKDYHCPPSSSFEVPPETFTMTLKPDESSPSATLLWDTSTETTPRGLSKPVLEPLEQRGWAFQEFLLSRRVIDLRNEGISFRCRMLHLKYHNLSINGRLRTERYKAPTLGRRPLMQDLKGSWNSAWKSIVQDYTSRNLTFQADRLPALAGVAKELGSMHYSDPAAEYVAGLWKDTLLLDLVWTVRDLRKRSKNHPRPTWSWVSVNAPVIWGYMSAESNCFKIDSMHITLRNEENPFGAVTSAELVLSGLSLHAVYHIHCSGTGNLSVEGLDSGYTCKNWSQDALGYDDVWMEVTESYLQGFPEDAFSNGSTFPKETTELEYPNRRFEARVLRTNVYWRPHGLNDCSLVVVKVRGAVENWARVGMIHWEWDSFKHRNGLPSRGLDWKQTTITIV